MFFEDFHGENEYGQIKKQSLDDEISKKSIRLIYLICNDQNGQLFDDGRFNSDLEENKQQLNSIESGLERIAIGARLAQYFFWKTVGKTFRLEPKSNQDDNPLVRKFLLGNGWYRDKLCCLSQRDLWRLVANQLMNDPDIGDVDCKYLAFCSFCRYEPNHRYPWWQVDKQVNGYVSLGGDGLALVSTHCLHCWPNNLSEADRWFRDYRLVDRQKFMDDSDNRNTRSGCFWTTFGAMLHELAHTFNLGHRTNSGIMSRQFKNIDKFFLDQQITNWWTREELVILRSNPWFDFNGHRQNQTLSSKKLFLLDIHRGILQSTYGLRLVEYRQADTDNVFEVKTFPEKTKSDKEKSVIRYYKLSNCNLKLSFKLFALDQRGNAKLFLINDRIKK